MSSPPPPPQQQQQPPRGFPAPCWAHDETVALIRAYRDKCLSLGRRTLRSTDWDDVAAGVSLQCPSSSSSSPKSSVQCRHKVEKLRRRYRAEKQRCASYSGRVFSSWDLFQLMDSVEAGSEPEITPAKTRGKKNPRDEDSDDDPSFDYGHSFQGGAKIPADRNDVVLGLRATSCPNSDLGLNKSNRYHKASDFADQDYPDQIPMEVRMRHRAADFTNSDYGRIACPLNAVGGRNMMSSRFMPKKPRTSSGMLPPDFGESDESDEDTGLPPSSGFRPQNGRAQAHAKRGMNLLTEMAFSIRQLGDEFVRVERMKMEMAREFEKSRMSFEMKRNEMIIKSEQMIISALVEAVHGNKKRAGNVVSRNIAG